MKLSDHNPYNKSYSGEIFQMQPLIWFLGIVIGVSLFLLEEIGVITPIGGFLSKPTIQLRSDIYQTSVIMRDFFTGLNDLPGITKENQQLQLENAELKARLAEVDVVFKQNQSLINETGIKYDADYDQIGVKVIGRDAARQGIVIINKGTVSGVEVGGVAVIEKLLVGQVIEASENTSKVRLLVNSQTELPVKKVNENVGLLVGKNGRELEVEQILQSKEIIVGDKIYTAGLNGNYPPDLYIGEVTNVESDERASTKTAKVASPLDWEKLTVFKILII